jgi:DNA-binding transcriptional LysR family regulator
MTHNNWNDWHYVVAVVEQGSLSAAARYLGVNHATVLRRIATFEDLHGVKFFERRQNGYVPTSDCQEILGRMRHLKNSVHELETAVKNLGNPFTGRVGITSTDTICQYILPRHIKRLNMLHSGLKIELSSTNSRLDLTGLDAEITIRPTSNLPGDLIGRRACDIAIEIYGSPDYLAENPSSDLNDHAWLCYVDTPTPTPMKTWEADNNLNNVYTLQIDVTL